MYCSPPPCIGCRSVRQNVLKRNGRVMMEGDVLQKNMFVIESYTVQMDQMRRIKSVHHGNVQQGDGSAGIISV